MAFPTKNYYEVLGISPQAQKPEIKDAYKKMALRCHPDKNPGKSTAVAIFQQIQAAYETLIDDNCRAHYDMKIQNRPPTKRASPPAPQFDQEAFTVLIPLSKAEIEKKDRSLQSSIRTTKIAHLKTQIALLESSLLSLSHLSHSLLSERKAAKKWYTLLPSRRGQKAEREAAKANRRAELLDQYASKSSKLTWARKELQERVEAHDGILWEERERDERERVWCVEEERKRRESEEEEWAWERGGLGRMRGEGEGGEGGAHYGRKAHHRNPCHEERRA